MDNACEQEVDLGQNYKFKSKHCENIFNNKEHAVHGPF